MEKYGEEILVRRCFFNRDFAYALKYFEAAQNVNDVFIGDALLKIGIVTYAKPFFKNSGVHKNVHNYRLRKSFVPENFIDLHEDLLSYRGSFIGHASFNVMMPELFPDVEVDGDMMPMLIWREINFDSWFDTKDDLDCALINNVISLARLLKDKMEEQLSLLEELCQSL